MRAATRRATWGSAVSALVLSGLATAAAYAQPNEDEGAAPSAAPVPPPDLDDGQRELFERGEALVREVEDAAGSLAELGERAEAAVGEEARVLHHELVDARLSTLEGLHALAENVAAQKAAGVPSGETREFLEEAMLRAADRLEELIRSTLEELDAVREATGAADGEGGDAPSTEALTFARDRVERLATGFADHVERMDALGLGAPRARRAVAAHLDSYAGGLAARIRLGRERAGLLSEGIAASPEDASLAGDLALVEKLNDDRLDALRAVLEPMKRLGLETSEYQTLLIEATGEVTTDVFDSEVAASLTERWVDDVKRWFVDSGPGLLVKLLVLLLIWVVARLLSRLLRGVVRKALGRGSHSQLLTETAVGFAGGAVMTFAALVALSQMGVEIGPLLAGLGIAGFVVGFALQDVLGNFAAGVMILFYRPFDVGHVVDVGGAFGKVKRMNLVSTTLLTFDNRTVIVPNKRIWGEVITNLSDEPIRRVDMVFGVSYGEDLPRVETVIREVLDADDRVLSEPAPQIKVDSLGDSSVNFIVRPWVNTPDYWQVYWAIHREMFIAFGKAGISIPFPQRDVHLFPGTQEMKLGTLGPPKTAAQPGALTGQPGSERE